jgi:recombinational DNA repair protein (RecF pathway)
VAKGARRAPSRFGFALEPLSRARFVFYFKPDRDLHLLSQAETLDPIGSRLADLARLAHAQAALELIDRVVWGEEPHPDCTTCWSPRSVTTRRRHFPPSRGVPAPGAGLLGYPPARRVRQLRQPSRAPLFSPARGGLLCDRCAAGEAGTVRLSADALAGLTLLLSRPVSQAGEFLEVRRTGELLRVVEAFLSHHFQRFQGLRSLEVLRSLPGFDPEPPPCPS